MPGLAEGPRVLAVLAVLGPRARVMEAAAKAKPGDWIVGRGWHQDKWERRPAPSVEGLPTHEGLGRVSPENPVFLSHTSGHGVFVNARALERAGITRETANPPGGEILRDARGQATGMLREAAASAEVLYTIVGGKVRYEKPAARP